MNKLLLIGSFCLLSFTALAQEANENVLPDSAEIKPLTQYMSEAERQQEDSSDLDYIAGETPLPELLCDDENLLQQVKDFIFTSEQKKPTSSVQEKRSRILLINNLHPFQEAAKEDIRGNFEASATVANLRINDKREIHRICVSRNNKSKKFRNTYLIIYPYANHYKVVVTNMILVPEKMDDATFIFKR